MSNRRQSGSKFNWFLGCGCLTFVFIIGIFIGLAFGYSQRTFISEVITSGLNVGISTSEETSSLDEELIFKVWISNKHQAKAIETAEGKIVFEITTPLEVHRINMAFDWDLGLTSTPNEETESPP